MTDSNQALSVYSAAIDLLSAAPDSEILATSVREVIAEAPTIAAKIAAARDAVHTMAKWRIEVDPEGAAGIYREAARTVRQHAQGDPVQLLTSRAVVEGFRGCQWPSRWELRGP